MVTDLRLSIPGSPQGATRRSSGLSHYVGVPARMGVLLLVVIAVTACRGSGSGSSGTGAPASQQTSTSPPAGRCQPGGTALRISAHGNRFDRQCLAGPAGTPLVVTFENQDRGVVHNLAIYSDAQGAQTLFRGKLILGVATVVYQVPALQAGSYLFRCDVHPQTMTGTLVVG